MKMAATGDRLQYDPAMFPSLAKTSDTPQAQAQWSGATNEMESMPGPTIIDTYTRPATDGGPTRTIDPPPQLPEPPAPYPFTPIVGGAPVIQIPPQPPPQGIPVGDDMAPRRKDPGNNQWINPGIVYQTPVGTPPPYTGDRPIIDPMPIANIDFSNTPAQAPIITYYAVPAGTDPALVPQPTSTPNPNVTAPTHDAVSSTPAPVFAPGPTIIDTYTPPPTDNPGPPLASMPPAPPPDYKVIPFVPPPAANPSPTPTHDAVNSTPTPTTPGSPAQQLLDNFNALWNGFGGGGGGGGEQSAPAPAQPGPVVVPTEQAPATGGGLSTVNIVLSIIVAAITIWIFIKRGVI